ncbi:MAG: gliding motility-associated C-terminal domain-containing protein [Bacteroidia bacterium]|nr:gliding motility-associated C-terminal domain-containing protein [Bacteroidia bacterium]
MKHLTYIPILLFCARAACGQCDPSFFAYSDTAFCAKEDTVTPLVLSSANGVFYSSPFGLNLESNGTIILTNSLPGNYSILLVMQDSCSNSFTQKLTIFPAEFADFSYPDSFFCTTEPIQFPNFSGTNGGWFWAGPGLAVDSLSGAIHPAQSVGGQYDVHYRSPGFCFAEDLFTVAIEEVPPAFLLNTAPFNTTCQGNSIEFLAGGGQSFQFWYGDSLLQSWSGLNQYESAQLPPGEQDLWVEVQSNQGCIGRDTNSIRIIPLTLLPEKLYPETVNGSGEFTITGTTNLNAAQVHWWINAPAADLISGATSPLTSTNGAWSLPLQFVLHDPITPADVKVFLQGEFEGCTGPIDTLSLTLMPSQSDLFIPGILTPNGDGHNDQWEIRFTGEGNEENYRVEVFNRAGGRVHVQHGFQATWTGENLPGGVYWYVIKDMRNQETVATGGLTIKR